MEPEKKPSGDTNPNPESGKKEDSKQADDLAQRVQELESQLVNQIERSNRAEKLLQTYMDGTPPAAAASPKNDDPYSGRGIDTSKLITDPDVVVNQIVKAATQNAIQVMEQRYKEAQELQYRAMEIRRKFYTDNPDLVGFEDIVGPIESGLRLNHPNTPYEQLLPLIAQTARKRVIEIKQKAGGGSNHNPPNLESGASSRDKGEQSPEAPETDDPHSYLEERKALRKAKI